MPKLLVLFAHLLYVGLHFSPSIFTAVLVLLDELFALEVPLGVHLVDVVYQVLGQAWQVYLLPIAVHFNPLIKVIAIVIRLVIVVAALVCLDELLVALELLLALEVGVLEVGVVEVEAPPVVYHSNLLLARQRHLHQLELLALISRVCRRVMLCLAFALVTRCLMYVLAVGIIGKPGSAGEGKVGKSQVPVLLVGVGEPALVVVELLEVLLLETTDSNHVHGLLEQSFSRGVAQVYDLVLGGGLPI